ncbi:pilus assembly protein [Intrasporangium calvum]|uniref:pilus assembly protein n=1 Tax=Intrasporangium calvum TaxID=53358 RepID=UPI000DF61720|nr:pilus assembly protein [Intrasporangium calvum]AXG12920.1 pilus assembly protein [Intrasporangium calvum]
MMRSRRGAPDRAHGDENIGDDGRAIVEFIFLGVLLLLPLTYLVLTLARIQAATFSASLAGREAGRAFVTGADDEEARGRAADAGRIAFSDFGFDEGATLVVQCDGTPCLRPDGVVTSTATIEVHLPLVPDVVAGSLPASVSISSTHVAAVDTYVAR